MSVQYGGDKITFADGSIVASGWSGFKNRIINGDFRIDQRNAGASVTPSSNQYTLDRWNTYQNVASKFSVQQNAGSVTPPAGFTKYLGVTSLSAYTVLSGGLNTIMQYIEGYNCADLAWGTANASPVTLSFKVYSSLTGTFGGSICNASQNRSYPFSYTISSANTWTTVSVTIAGDTSGTWATDNTAGICVFFGLGVGSTYSGTAGAWAGSAYFSATGATSVVGTNGATFYITGVQLEKGSTATSFDYRPYGTELQLCQRYYQIYTSTGMMLGVGSVSSSSAVYRWGFTLNQSMRAVPTVTLTNMSIWSGSNTPSVTLGSNYCSTNNIDFDLTTTGLSPSTQGIVAKAYFNAGSSIQISAEL